MFCGGVQICEVRSKSANGYGPGGSKSAVTPASEIKVLESGITTLGNGITSIFYGIGDQEKHKPGFRDKVLVVFGIKVQHFG